MRVIISDEREIEKHKDDRLWSKTKTQTFLLRMAKELKFRFQMYPIQNEGKRHEKLLQR